MIALSRQENAENGDRAGDATPVLMPETVSRRGHAACIQGFRLKSIRQGGRAHDHA